MSAANRTAFVFPGQGSQKVGMGQRLAEASASARAVFDAVDEALGFELSKLCFEGPEEELQLTANTQPAILATSVAAYRLLEERGYRPQMVAGHSLGEYSALVAAGALELAEAARLVRRRGELMQEAVPVGVGAMAAILGLPTQRVEELVASAGTAGEVCEVANYNAPEQTVIAGHAAAVERAMSAAREAGAKRALPLPVSAPFHCSLMAPARERMTPLLLGATLVDPQVPVVCNVDAREVRSGEDVRDALIRQIDSPVRWVESVHLLDERLGGPLFVEVGPGNVLSGLVRRIASGARTAAVAEPEAVERLEQTERESARGG